MKFNINSTESGVRTVKLTSRIYVIFITGVALLSLSWLQPAAIYAGVCSQGTGIPPFLEGGADPNLLLLLDNSGSMLDMAYNDETTQCFDDSYDSAITYGGYFEEDSWYVWDDTDNQWVPRWTDGIDYYVGDIVYANGGLYQAQNEAISNDNDNRDGYNLLDDVGVDWEQISQALTVDELPASCTNDELMAYNNFVHICDNSVDLLDPLYPWRRLEGGQFVVQGDIDAMSQGDIAAFAQSETDALAACAAATGDIYNYSGELCITVKSVVIPKDPPRPATTVQEAMNAFAARGNFLNWASASKFDIQKKILTGGKYDSDINQLIGESRGCGGSGFVKQVAITASDSSTQYLSMRVRGANSDDRVGDLPKDENSDDTTRIEIVGISESGFDQGACQVVIDKLTNNPDTLSQNQIDLCLGGTNEVGISQAALSTSVNICRQMNDITNPDDSDVPNLVTTVAAKCEDLFLNYSYSPSTMSPEDGGYVCYGFYDNDDAPDNLAGDGYMGRCWDDGTASNCGPKLAVVTDDGCSNATEADPCYYDIGGNDLYKNQYDNDNALYYNYRCLDVKGNATTGYYCKTSDDWYLQYATENGTECDPAAVASGAWVPNWDPNASPGDANLHCITQAMIDFCGYLKVPEVIDPSDQATTTTDYWNIPAMLIDGGVLGQLGVAKSLVVMKSLIRYDQPAEQENEKLVPETADRPDGPRGVIFDVADLLRLGVMAFTDNGAQSECDILMDKCKDSSDFSINDVDYNGVPAICETNPESEDCTYCNDRKAIVKYCPAENSDGAKILQPIKEGMTIDENSVEHWDHYKDLLASVNGVRATSWTPLAEAMFNAIGYYTQNDAFCLDSDNFGNCLSFPIDNDDPVQYWCQDNNILVITEGASTADINLHVAGFVAAPENYFVTHDITNDDVTGDTASDLFTDNDCAGGLDGSTYLDDMTWWGRHVEPLYFQRKIIDSDGVEHDKQIITTHIVTTSLLSTDGEGECSPEVLMQQAAANGEKPLYSGNDPDELESNLRAVFSDILARASAGSAASVISSSRSGSGAIYQAIFWPELTDEDDNTVEWVGDVHALFMSSDGLMYEDTNHDGKLFPSGDLNNNQLVDNDEVAGGDDKRVIFYYSVNANKTRGCYNITDFVSGGFVCPDDPRDTFCLTGDDCVEIQDVNYLWSASNKLRDMDPDDRNIFTWNDFNNNGEVDTGFGEWFRLDNNVDWNVLNGKTAPSRGLVTTDFLTSEDWSTFVDNDHSSSMELDAMDGLVSWIRGEDQLNNEITDDNTNGRLDKKLRSRHFYMDSDSQTKEWRLGDIIHSTPIVVAKPAEAYHLIYRDPTYAQFARRWAKRRNMIYFGANDGMLHAVNGGFYSERLNQFCCGEISDNDECSYPVNLVNGCEDYNEPDLGEEKWAYIPYNLQPHLKCLADPDYVHKYFVDHKPRIFDVQIFVPDVDHVAGWGTILVGSMRFGGAPIAASDLNGDNDDREFTSSFFILDITNPEADPVLLGEMTRTTEDGNQKWVDLNYTTSSPSMVVMRDNDNFGVRTDWYLVMGNGPTDLDGSNDNDNQGKLAILPLEWLQGDLSSWGADGVPTGSYGTKRPFRIHNKRPDGGTNSGDSGEGGRFLIPRTDSGEPSYVSDIITVDFDVENQGSFSVGALYRADAVYFGTTDGTGFANYPPPDNDQSYWNGGGRLFRLVTKKALTNQLEVSSKPSEWAAAGWSSPDNDPIRMLVDAKAPITAAQSVGYDGYNFWVYAGTGRFYGKKDKTDDGQYISPADNSKISYFGIREPIDTLGNCYDRRLTWDTINWDINDNDNGNLAPKGTNGTPGDRGLMQVDDILVVRGGESLDCVHCVDNDDNRFNPICVDSNDCFGNTGLTESSSFIELRDYIAGTGCDNDDTSTGIDGWYRDFHEPRERNLGQAALLGGLLTFTGYQPYNDICMAEGESFLYGVQYQTGVAWIKNVFGTYYYGGQEIVMDKLSLGRGLATTPSMHSGSGGKGPAKAFVQTSTGEIVEIVQENLPFEDTRSGRIGWNDRCEP